MKISRSGNAAIEFMLLIPIYFMLLALIGSWGSSGRVLSQLHSKTGEFLNENGGSWEELVSNRANQSVLDSDEIEKMWRIQHGPDDVQVTISSFLYAKDPAFTLSQPTNQSGDYTDDQIGLEEEFQRLLSANSNVIWNPEGGDTYIQGPTPAIAWLANYGGELGYSGLADTINNRSSHKTIRVSTQIASGTSKLFSNEATVIELNSTAHHRSQLTPSESGVYYYSTFAKDPTATHSSFINHITQATEEDGSLDILIPVPLAKWNALKLFHKAN